jgi:hypothetical protein
MGLIDLSLPVYDYSNQSFVLTPHVNLISLRDNAFANEEEVLSKCMKFQHEYSAREPSIVDYVERHVNARRA